MKFSIIHSEWRCYDSKFINNSKNLFFTKLPFTNLQSFTNHVLQLDTQNASFGQREPSFHIQEHEHMFSCPYWYCPPRIWRATCQFYLIILSKTWLDIKICRAATSSSSIINMFLIFYLAKCQKCKSDISIVIVSDLNIWYCRFKCAWPID